MPGVLNWGWDDTNKKWIPVISDTEGRIKMSIVIARLDDINDVNVPSPSDDDILYWDAAAGEWKAKASAAGAHASTHEKDGADEIDVVGLTGLLADDQHVLDAEAKAAAVLAGAITNGETRAPTHDAVYDVKVVADAAQTAAQVDADIATHAGIATAHHTKYTDAEAKAQAEGAKLDDHAAPDDNTDLDATAALHGLMAKADKSKLDGVAAGADVTGDNAPQAHEDSHKSGGSDEIDEPLALTAMPTSIKTTDLTFIIDGGGSAITTGEKGHLEIPFACTITQVTMLADVSGSIVVDIWKDTYANFPPDNSDSITASAPPTITTAQKSQDSTLTGWTTAIAADDILAFNVDSCTTITRVTISLKVTKS